VLTVAVLDVVELRRDGVHIPVRPGKTTEVLVRLALDAGVRVRTDQLIEDLWAGHAVTTARNTLQTKVSRLRRALGDASLVTGGSDGYTLHVDPDCVDALRVARLAAVAEVEHTAGDDAAAHRTCSGALALFGTDVLRGAGDGDWLVPHRVRLQELRLNLVEQDLTARLALGEAHAVVADLEALVLLHPLAESLWTLLMLALYRCGRQADALSAYRRVSAVLADELGLEPGASLRAMEQRVLMQDPRLEPADENRASSRCPVRGNLPSLSSRTVGRAEHENEIQALVSQHRLVTIVGTAGVGKTRVAVDVARQQVRRDGTWLIRLDSARDKASTLHALAAAVGVASGSESDVLQHLHATDALLLFDSCEHVVDRLQRASAAFLPPLPTSPCSARASCRWAWAANASIRSSLSRSKTPWCCSGNSRSPSERPSSWTVSPARPWARSAARWTDFRWRSNSLRPVPRHCPSRRSLAGSATASRC
jgi:DNA-binding SARP family transcriptional activator